MTITNVTQPKTAAQVATVKRPEPVAEATAQEAKSTDVAAKAPAEQSVVDAVREKVQGIGEAIKDSLFPDGVKGPPLAGGPWRPCGRSKCTASRGLSSGTTT